MHKCIKFYLRNTYLLPPEPASSFRHLKQGFQEFYGKYVLALSDKNADKVVVVSRLHFVCEQLQKLSVRLGTCKIDLSPPVILYYRSFEGHNFLWFLLFYALVFKRFVLFAPYVCFHVLVKFR